MIRPGVLIQGFQLPGVRPGGQSWGSTRGFSSTCHCSQRVGSELRELRDTTHQGRWRTKETSSVLGPPHLRVCEQTDGSPGAARGERSDLQSAGVTSYQVCYTTPPRCGSTFQSPPSLHSCWDVENTWKLLQRRFTTLAPSGGLTHCWTDGRTDGRG